VNLLLRGRFLFALCFAGHFLFNNYNKVKFENDNERSLAQELIETVIIMLYERLFYLPFLGKCNVGIPTARLAVAAAKTKR
jgi:hypothetical protein